MLVRMGSRLVRMQQATKRSSARCSRVETGITFCGAEGGLLQLCGLATAPVEATMAAQAADWATGSRQGHKHPAPNPAIRCPIQGCLMPFQGVLSYIDGIRHCHRPPFIGWGMSVGKSWILWEAFEAFGRPFGRPLEAFRRPLEAFGRPWEALGCLSEALGSLLEALGVLGEALGGLWEAFGRPVARAVCSQGAGARDV